MTDITKCSGEKCKKKDNCYRFMVKSSNYQSYQDPENPKDCKDSTRCRIDDSQTEAMK